MRELLLAEQVIVITGAGGGLGRAYALECARHGGAVVVNDIDPEAAERTAAAIVGTGGRAVAHAGSVESWSAAKDLADLAVSEFGALTGLVNNAGVHYTALPWEEVQQQLDRIVGVNLLGAMYSARHAMTHMLAGGGAIVNIVSGAQAGILNMSAYGATKGALSSLTYAWAIEGAPYGIRVNAVSPIASTGMTPKLADGTPGERPSPSSVAPLVAALLSPSSAPVTGRAFGFDGTRLSTVRRPDRDTIEIREQWDAAALLVRLRELQAAGAER